MMWTVGSSGQQWAVGSGQWAVDSGLVDPGSSAGLLSACCTVRLYLQPSLSHCRFAFKAPHLPESQGAPPVSRHHAAHQPTTDPADHPLPGP